MQFGTIARGGEGRGASFKSKLHNISVDVPPGNWIRIFILINMKSIQDSSAGMTSEQMQMLLVMPVNLIEENLAERENFRNEQKNPCVQARWL